MTYGYRAETGFTLIELLVVVLIIGILVALALPQYRKAVLRSQTAQAYTMIKSIADAQRRHLLENGKYAANFSELDIDIPGTVTTETATQGIITKGDWQFWIDSEYGVNPGACISVWAVHTPSGLNIRFDFYGTNQEDFFCINGNAGASALVRSVCSTLGKPVTCPVFCGNSWMVNNVKCWKL